MAQKLKRFRARNVCYTAFEEPNVGGPNQDYNIFGIEECPTTGKIHYQGYVEFDRPMDLNSIKKSLGTDKIHIEPRKGTQKQAIEYCKKDGDVTEWNVPNNQGKRTDLDDIKTEILSGKKNSKLIRNESPMLYHLYGRTLDKLEDDFNSNKKRTWMTKGLWLFGPTGCGKSLYAYSFDPESTYTWVNDKGWQDHYNGERTIIIDDFRGGIEYNELLKMMDRWDYKLSRRGRSPMPLLATNIIITSSLPPEKVYRNLSKYDSLDQLKRRCKIVEMSYNDLEDVVNSKFET